MYKCNQASDPLEILQNLFLFQGVDIRTTEAQYPFLEACAFSTFSEDEIIQCAEHPLQAMAVMIEGKASVLSDASDQGVCLRFLQAGDVFGVAGIYGCQEMQYETIIRANSTCTIFMLPAPIVQKLILHSPAIAENYIRFLSDRIRFLNKKISVFTAGTAEAKLAMYLLSLPIQEDGSVLIPVSMSGVAASLNMGRASLYRALDSLEENGVLTKISRNRYQCNVPALQQLLR